MLAVFRLLHAKVMTKINNVKIWNVQIETIDVSVKKWEAWRQESIKNILSKTIYKNKDTGVP